MTFRTVAGMLPHAMPIATPTLLERIKKIVRKWHNAFIVSVFGPEALPDETVEELRASGMIGPESGAAVDDAYLYGRAAAVLDNPATQDMTAAQVAVWARANPVELSRDEQTAIRAARLSAAEYCQGLGNIIEKRTGQLIIEGDRQLRERLRGEIADDVVAGLEARKTAKAIKTGLGWSTADWTRNLDRIAITEKHTAMQQGVADGIRRRGGDDARVAVMARPDACPSCKRFANGPDGAPRIYRLSQLGPPGANVHRKQVEWVPCVGSVHPHCHPAGTRITTPRGWLAIDHVLPGDLVLTEQGRWRRVTHTWTSRYSGMLVKLECADGTVVYATPDHPLFSESPTGCETAVLPAKALKRGDNLVRLDVNGEAALPVEHDAEDGPSAATQRPHFARILHGFTRAGVPVTAIDFHGELFLREGEVYEKRPDDEAGERGKSAGAERVVDEAFAGAFELTALGLEYREDVGARVPGAPAGSVRRFRAGLTFLRAGPEVAEALGLRLLPDFYPSPLQTQQDRPAAYVEPLGDLLYREQLVEVHVHDGGKVEFAPERHAPSKVPTTVRHSSRIVNVSFVPGTSVVYNLTVDEDHSYIADGVASHNCQCQLVRVPDGWGFTEDGTLEPGGKLGVEMDEDDDTEKALRAEDLHLEALEKARRLAGRVTFQGLPISIEQDVGDTREWKDEHSGEAGSTRFTAPYGYIRGTEGADGDHVDVFVGPNPAARNVYVVHQRKKGPDGKFGEYDEDKCILGASSAPEAHALYLAHYDNPGFFGGMSVMGMDEFKTLLEKRFGKPLVPEKVDEMRPISKAELGSGKAPEWKFVVPAKAEAPADDLRKGGPYMGPRGGLWADFKHTIHWEAIPKAVQALLASDPRAHVEHKEDDPTHVVVKVPASDAHKLADVRNKHGVESAVKLSGEHAQLVVKKEPVAAKEPALTISPAATLAPPAPAPAPRAPVKVKKTTLHHPGAAAPAGWKKDVPGPGFHATTDYKGKQYGVKFHAGDGGKMAVEVQLPDGSTHMVDSPNKASDLITVHATPSAGLDYRNFTSTQLKEKKLGYSFNKLFQMEDLKPHLTPAPAAPAAPAPAPKPAFHYEPSPPKKEESAPGWERMPEKETPAPTGKVTPFKLGKNGLAGMQIYVMDAAHTDPSDALDEDHAASIRAAKLLTAMVQGDTLRVPESLTGAELDALADRVAEASNSADDDEERKATNRGVALALSTISGRLRTLAEARKQKAAAAPAPTAPPAVPAVAPVASTASSTSKPVAANLWRRTPTGKLRLSDEGNDVANKHATGLPMSVARALVAYAKEPAATRADLHGASLREEHRVAESIPAEERIAGEKPAMTAPDRLIVRGLATWGPDKTGQLRTGTDRRQLKLTPAGIALAEKAAAERRSLLARVEAAHGTTAAGETETPAAAPVDVKLPPRAEGPMTPPAVTRMTVDPKRPGPEWLTPFGRAAVDALAVKQGLPPPSATYDPMAPLPQPPPVPEAPKPITQAELQAQLEELRRKYDEARAAHEDLKAKHEELKARVTTPPPAPTPTAAPAPAAPRERAEKLGGSVGKPAMLYMAAAQGAPQKQKAHYVLMDATKLIPSHNPLDGFRPRPEYPEGVQERRYDRDEAEQLKVHGVAQQLNPEVVFAPAVDAINGPPVVTRDGIVLGGNGRSMGLQLHYARGDTSADATRTYLAEHAADYGFTADEVRAVQNPVIVRMVDETPKDKKEAATLVRRYNESSSQGMDSRAAASGEARRMSDESLALLSAIPEDATLAEFLSSKASAPFVSSLRRAGILNQRNASALLMADGTLNDDGRQLVSRVLTAALIPEPNLVEDMGGDLRQTLARAAPAILAAGAESEPGWDLRPALNAALRDYVRAKSQGAVTPDEYLNQQGLFAATDKKAVHGVPMGEQMLRVLWQHGGKPTVFTKMMRAFQAASKVDPRGQIGMFAETKKTPEQALADISGVAAVPVTEAPPAVAPAAPADEQRGMFDVPPAPAPEPESMGLFDAPANAEAVAENDKQIAQQNREETAEAVEPGSAEDEPATLPGITPPPPAEEVLMADAREETDPEVSRQKARAVGEHIERSRKDMADLLDKVRDGNLDQLSYAEAAQLVRKNTAMPTLDLEHYKSAGATPGAAHLGLIISSLVASKPGDSDEERKAYLEGTRMVAGGLQKIRTTKDAVAFAEEMRDEVRHAGHHIMDLPPEMQAEMTALVEKRNRIRRGFRDLQVGRQIAYDSPEMKAYSQNLRAVEDELEKFRKRVVDLVPGGENAYFRADYTRGGVQTSDVMSSPPLEARGDGGPMTLRMVVSVPADRAAVYAKYSALGSRFIAGLNLRVPQETTRRGAAVTKVIQRNSWDTAFEKAKPVAESWDARGWEAYEGNSDANAKDQEGAQKGRKDVKEREKPWQQEVAEKPELRGIVEANPTGDPKALAKAFKLRGVQSGENIPEDEFTFHVARAHTALKTLADVLEITPEQVSLNGRLGIAFAARGRGGKAAAHYEPDKKAINLTRFKGAGTLAHEWGHFLDNLVAEMHGAKTTAGKGSFASELRPGTLPDDLNEAMQTLRSAMFDSDPVALRERNAKLTAEMREAQQAADEHVRKANQIVRSRRMGAGVQNPTADQLAARAEHEDLIRHYKSARARYNELSKLASSSYQSSFALHAASLDGAKPGRYWSQPLEMYARAFEAYVQDKLEDNGKRNSYLVDGTRKQYLMRQKVAGESAQPYPQGEERKRINRAFDELFRVLRAGKHLEKALRYLDELGKAGPTLNDPSASDRGLPAAVGGVVMEDGRGHTVTGSGPSLQQRIDPEHHDRPFGKPDHTNYRATLLAGQPRTSVIRRDPRIYEFDADTIDWRQPINMREGVMATTHDSLQAVERDNVERQSLQTTLVPRNSVNPGWAYDSGKYPDAAEQAPVQVADDDEDDED